MSQKFPSIFMNIFNAKWKFSHFPAPPCSSLEASSVLADTGVLVVYYDAVGEVKWKFLSRAIVYAHRRRRGVNYNQSRVPRARFATLVTPCRCCSRNSSHDGATRCCCCAAAAAAANQWLSRRMHAANVIDLYGGP